MSNFPSLEEFDAANHHITLNRHKPQFKIQDEIPSKTIYLNDTQTETKDANINTLYVEEPIFLQEWRQQRELDIQKRDEENELKKIERIEAAKEAIKNFYETYNRKKEAEIQKARIKFENRKKQEEFLLERSKESHGTLWERIVKLLNLSDTTSGLENNNISKFKELLLNLEKDPNAPGANNT
ncbi:uncharacterized protein T551_01467 [Pneumocystis jirovecii RU7]|uniref:Clathrin light chain n=1 Tax=Pneumocystis jirovecii (strain RU7) TaxID=1408657 RepID=A0A0W4ZRC1_PNEJ7|nr:uncharacterized protein T551_01467 [Pneumocystis jirovecii RU7]KTW30915.1 hypothetical protein T551_01467 [Pneumocystis jirovecii RU7]